MLGYVYMCFPFYGLAHGIVIDTIVLRTIQEHNHIGILLDGSTAADDPRLLLQIFSETQIGPVFFEFIQRKKDEGFGEGNFTALFKSIEMDQIRRGALTVEPEAAR